MHRGHTWQDFPRPWVSLTWLLYNLQLWRYRRWFRKFTVRFRPIRKEIVYCKMYLFRLRFVVIVCVVVVCVVGFCVLLLFLLLRSGGLISCPASLWNSTIHFYHGDWRGDDKAQRPAFVCFWTIISFLGRHPVPIDDFERHVDRMHMDGDHGFSEEYLVRLVYFILPRCCMKIFLHLTF